MNKGLPCGQGIVHISATEGRLAEGGLVIAHALGVKSAERRSG